MPLILPGNVASAVSGAYDVANSCRFNEAVMHVTPSSEGDTQKMTLSMWVKRGELGVEQQMWHTQNGSNQATTLVFGSDDKLYFIADDSNKLITTRVFRDPSAWYHIVLAIDTTNGTAGNRARLYVNGVEETVFDTDSAPSENQDLQWNKTTSHRIGSQADTANNAYNGYLAEVCWIDGTQYAASDFGEFDEDSPTIWKPINVSGLTFGTNGFYLDFEASGNLGNNAATGAADLTEVGIAATDQSLDSPTNNFCVMNPLDNYFFDATFSEGNTNLVLSDDGNETYGTGTIGLSAGKWYFEVKHVSDDGGDSAYPGITHDHSQAKDDYYLGRLAGEYAYGGDGNWYTANSGTTSGYTAYGPGSIIGVYVDLDNNKLYFSLNGTIQDSGTGIDITAPASLKHGVYFPAVSYRESGSTATFAMNFGNGQFADTALSSANTDANGYGSFEYDPSSGTFDSASKDFLAICTKNLGSSGG